MRLEQQQALPVNHGFPVNIQLRIQADSRGYIAYVQPNWGTWYRIRVGLTHNDVEELNTELQSTLEEASSAFDSEAIEEEDRKEALNVLARKGNFAFKHIFAEGTPRDTISKALSSGGTIQIAAEEFILPWELLYNGALGNELDGNQFWGMQHVISRAIIQDARPADFVSPQIQCSCPHVGLISCGELRHVQQEEVPLLQQLEVEKKILLTRLRALDPESFDQELTAFDQFLRQEFQITHLACHAIQKKPLTQSYLVVEQEFPISIQDFIAHDFWTTHNPVVILNACRTGTMNPLYTSNWASLLWSRGARGVLATEFRVPDWFAAAFIQVFYEHFLASETIGASLMATRRHFWETQGNPLGLTYALYSSPMIQIIK